MPKIKELIQFQEIEDSIDLERMGNKKAMVQDFIISPSLEKHLVKIFEDVNCNMHKVVQIAGGHGSGKSHLLGFIISILKDRNLIQYINNKRVRETAENIDKDFIIIQWKPRPSDTNLFDSFYDCVEKQLKEEYNIKNAVARPPPTSDSWIYKNSILHIMQVIRRVKPQCCLVVVIDEIYDIFKQKSQEKILQDFRFLKILGLAAQKSDFTYLGSIQRKIYTYPKYIDELFRFVISKQYLRLVELKTTDLEKVISNRVLRKSQSQRKELVNLFSDYANIYPGVNSDIDRFVDLFPLHPYVIDALSDIPCFEKESIIQFATEQVNHIIDNDFPSIITYDRLYGLIEYNPSIITSYRFYGLIEYNPPCDHLDDVLFMVNATNTLIEDNELLDYRDKNIARKTIKALAVSKLCAKKYNKGFTPEELACGLLIIPSRFDANDEITLIINKLRRITDGQFIDHTLDGHYYLDLKCRKQVIKRRTDYPSGLVLGDMILRFFKETFNTKEEVEIGYLKVFVHGHPGMIFLNIYLLIKMESGKYIMKICMYKC